MLYAGLSAEALAKLPSPVKLKTSVSGAGAAFERSVSGRLLASDSPRPVRTAEISWKLLSEGELDGILSVVGADAFYLGGSSLGEAAAFRLKSCDYGLTAREVYDLRIVAEEV